MTFCVILWLWLRKKRVEFCGAKAPLPRECLALGSYYERVKCFAGEDYAGAYFEVLNLFFACNCFYYLAFHKYAYYVQNIAFSDGNYFAVKLKLAAYAHAAKYLAWGAALCD